MRFSGMRCVELVRPGITDIHWIRVFLTVSKYFYTNFWLQCFWAGSVSADVRMFAIRVDVRREIPCQLNPVSDGDISMLKLNREAENALPGMTLVLGGEHSSGEANRSMFSPSSCSLFIKGYTIPKIPNKNLEIFQAGTQNPDGLPQIVVFVLLNYFTRDSHRFRLQLNKNAPFFPKMFFILFWPNYQPAFSGNEHVRPPSPEKKRSTF